MVNNQDNKSVCLRTIGLIVAPWKFDIKHSEFHEKYPAALRIFFSVFGYPYSHETLSLVFDILHQISSGNYQLIVS